MGCACSQEDRSSASAEELVPIVYDELRRIARFYFRKQPPGFTLRPTELVNEACLALIQRDNGKWYGPDHFRLIATKKIWQVVVDHLRKRQAKMRGGPGRRLAAENDPGGDELSSQANAHPHKHWRRVPLESIAVEWQDQTVDLLDLAAALDVLKKESRRHHDVVIMRWFGGLKYAEVAGHLGVSESTVEKDSRYALAWLNRRLSNGGGHGD